MSRGCGFLPWLQVKAWVFAMGLGRGNGFLLWVFAMGSGKGGDGGEVVGLKWRNREIEIGERAKMKR